MNDDAGIRLTTPDDYATAAIELLDGANRSVELFSPDFTPVVFGTPLLIEAVREFALRNRHTTLRVLIRDTGPLTKDEHRFRILAQRISSKVLIRALASDFHSRNDAFIVADDDAYAVRRQASTWDGILDRSRPEAARELRTAFEKMWSHSLPDPGVRRLQI